MKSAELVILADTFEAAKDIREFRIKQVIAETQGDIDRFGSRLVDGVSPMLRRYKEFKLGLLSQGITIGCDIYPVEVIDVESLVFDNYSLTFSNITYADHSHPVVKYLTVPMGYFDDPDKWEEKTMEWIDAIRNMTARASSVLDSQLVWTAHTMGLSPADDMFSLRGSAVDREPRSYSVDYRTGLVYHRNKAGQAPSGSKEPISCLR